MAKNKDDKPKKPFIRTDELTSKEQWEKWNEDYFGENNFRTEDELDDDGDPMELNFDH